MKYGTATQITDQIYELFKPVEGKNAVYYGKTRNGKTRTATADILELLKRGEVVYANWAINFEGFDERDDFRIRMVNFFFGRTKFFVYHKENFHYISPDELIEGNGVINVKFLDRLVGVHLFIDEGQWLFNSMEKYNPNDEEIVAKARLILHGGHYCRTLNVITQRPQNINKNIRSQINIWYRCVKRLDFGNFMIFQRWEIEDMKDDLPVETISKHDREGKLIRDIPNGICKNYYVNKKHDPVFKAYNTHAMRGADSIVVRPDFDVYETTKLDRLAMLMGRYWPRKATMALRAFYRKIAGGKV